MLDRLIGENSRVETKLTQNRCHVMASPALKVILISGYHGYKNESEKIKSLGYSFLEKPFTMVDLMTAIKSALVGSAADLS